MADERDFDLLDDYLTHRMSDQDRSAFEQQLQADPDLQHEHALQQHLIKGIQNARVAELKAMLNQVPVPANNTGNSLASKIILGAVVSIIIAAAVYWYANLDAPQMAQPKTIVKQPAEVEKPVVPEPIPEVEPKQERPVVAEKSRTEADKNQTSAGTEHSKPSLANKPAPLNAPAPVKIDPATENNSNGKTDDPATGLIESKPIVETVPDDRRYTFHYQFREGKLYLFGPFENHNNEILELVTDENPAAFLFYKDHYYLLGKADDNIQPQPLVPVSDPVLLEKLNEKRLEN